MDTLSGNILLDTGKEDAIVQLTDEGDRYYHSHDFYEIFYITSGKILHSLNSRTETLTLGDVRFLRPGDVHCFLREPSDECIHRDFIISVSLYEKIASFFKYDPFGAFHSQPSAKLDMNAVVMLETSLKHSGKLRSAEDPAFYFAVAELFRAHYEYERKAEKKIKAPEWITGLINKLERPEYFCLDVKDIFAEYNYSKEYVSRTFRKITGKTLTDYINRKKLSLASVLIQNTNKSIETICYECGFNNVSYFYRTFKETFGSTPHELRKIAPTEKRKK